MTMNWRPIIAVLMTICASPTATLPASAAWDHAHGDAANTGFARVTTAPAVKPQQTVQLGTLAPAAGPVIGPNGMLYVGTMHGKALAFQPDGTPAWTKVLPLGDPFLASPVVDAEGSVYLASSRKDEGRTHDGGAFTHYESSLHKLNGDTGAFAWSVHFPGVTTGRAARTTGGPVAAAPPSIWRSGSIEVVVMPVIYIDPGGNELRLLAFAPQNGALLGNTLVASKQVEYTGSGWEDWFGNWNLWDWGCVLAIGAAGVAYFPCHLHFNSPIVCGDPCLEASWPMPGVAIAPDRRGGPPLVIVSDELNQDTVGYRFDPATGFAEAFRVHDPARARTSTPTVLPDGHIVMGTQDRNSDRGRVTFPGPAAPTLADRKNMLSIAAAPTRMQDGKIVVMQLLGSMAVFRANTIFGRFKLNGESIASAAASCTHLFVASDGAFTTYDAKRLVQVAQVPWSGGGRSSPIIGPAGHVYSVTHGADGTDVLFVWPPPSQRRVSAGLLGTACDPQVIHR